jgi:hypothetical protein
MLEQTRRAQPLQVLRRVGHGERRHAGQLLHRARALAEEVEQFQPFGTGQRVADPSELLVRGVLELAGGRGHRRSNIQLHT